MSLRKKILIHTLIKLDELLFPAIFHKGCHALFSPILGASPEVFLGLQILWLQYFHSSLASDWSALLQHIGYPQCNACNTRVWSMPSFLAVPIENIHDLLVQVFQHITLLIRVRVHTMTLIFVSTSYAPSMLSIRGATLWPGGSQCRPILLARPPLQAWDAHCVYSSNGLSVDSVAPMEAVLCLAGQRRRGISILFEAAAAEICTFRDRSPCL